MFFLLVGVLKLYKQKAFEKRLFAYIKKIYPQNNLLYFLKIFIDGD